MSSRPRRGIQGGAGGDEGFRLARCCRETIGVKPNGRYPVPNLVTVSYYDLSIPLTVSRCL